MLPIVFHGFQIRTTGNCGGCGAVCVVGSPPTCCDGVCTDLSSSVDNCGACDAPTCTGTQPACCSGVCKDLDNNFASCGACDITYQPAAQAPVLISLMIPSTVVLAIRHPVLDSRLAAVRARVLIWRPRLLIAVRVVIRVMELHQLAALGLLVT
ncbi:hypothetical protein N7455_005742 [Penicillium solitum]|uniref:uncharacterized protein n=1 Tax=Penicillium solitum TaxID=60172 RepID=UPI0032C45D11|nr:hypothetical protein N7455_005742 [Penicillium solitum]